MNGLEMVKCKKFTTKYVPNNNHTENLVNFPVTGVFHLPQGYSLIIILCSTEVINGLTISIPSTTTS